MMESKIRYDKKTMKLIRIITIISLTMLLIGILLMLLEISQTALFMLIGIYVGGGTSLFGIMTYLDGLGYFARLRKHGYEVPEDRKLYSNSLVNLPYTDRPVDTSKRNSESMILTIAYATVLLVCVIINCVILFQWNDMIGEALFIVGVLSVLDLFWLISAIRFGVQMNQAKYKDDVERDPKRKNRTSLAYGLIVAVIFIALTLAAKAVAINMLKYVQRSREMEQKQVSYEMPERYTMELHNII